MNIRTRNLLYYSTRPRGGEKKKKEEEEKSQGDEKSYLYNNVFWKKMSDDVGMTSTGDDDGCLFWKESVAVKRCGWKMTFQWHPRRRVGCPRAAADTKMMDDNRTIFLATVRLNDPGKVNFHKTELANRRIPFHTHTFPYTYRYRILCEFDAKKVWE